VDLTNKDLKELRISISEGLPDIDHAGSTPQRDPAFTYVPPSHAQALEPERCVVEGIRGAGKSFWWAALSSQQHRDFIRTAYPDVHLAPEVTVRQGFGDASGSSDAPSKDVLAALSGKYRSARPIWRAVVAQHLEFPNPFPRSTNGKPTTWASRVAWVHDNPETFDALLLEADAKLAKSGKIMLLLFDALDRLAETWDDIRPLARGLLQVAQDLRATRSVRLKLFVRPDMLEDKQIVGFPDASKLLARRANLVWRRADLYALLYQCVANAPTGGVFRALTKRTLRLDWARSGSSWLIPTPLRSDEKLQEKLFEQLAGKAMSNSPTGLKRGKPYKWVVNHLQDGRDQVSPRSFGEALRRAAQGTSNDFDTHRLPLHFRAIHTGVQAASEVRVNELIGEDYPWVDLVMEPLRGELVVPCSPADIGDIWKKKRVLQSLNEELQKLGEGVKLPPQHLDGGIDGLLTDLEELGLVQRLLDGRIQMPDVYRIAFGLGRKGGVSPLK
jgi:hypothetical protein